MSLGQELAPHLPFLRRYARALTGSQSHGDAFVRATLEAIVAAPDDFPRDVDPRLGLYRTFHAIWSSANIEEDPGDAGERAMPRGDRPGPAVADHAAVAPGAAADRDGGLHARGCRLSDRRHRRRGRTAGRRGARRDRAPDPRRRADHRGRADHRDGHRDDRPRSRPQRHRRRRHPRRGGGAGAWRSARAWCSPTSSSPTTARASTR